MNQVVLEPHGPPSGAPLPSRNLVDEPQLEFAFGAGVESPLRDAALAWLEIAASV